MTNKLGEYIKNFRTVEHDYSLRQFAQMCDISHTHIDSIERGVDPRTGKVVKVTIDTLEKLANAMNVSSSFLLDLSLNKDVETPAKFKPQLPDKDEKDIAKSMKKLKEQLKDEQGLMFDGEPLDDTTIELLLEELERQERLVKKINKKYTPKKYLK
ncbi:hypothetical protein HMPREF9629_00463 [Peptoanaerobacter stomatis]|uniref:HTH cro/C1-type domain-containing protein n=1 Tax=Peptoanaerobacter stomatis TaxID=796937 RepID=G9X240_9FIRM|nr:helix-turn-helix transcriptional regulator [Peptoanaerobacter stomatis]EHL13163.1 hypothetical protein HMPREF9629_00463 [Peptoanaerobacter stomatis]